MACIETDNNARPKGTDAGNRLDIKDTGPDFGDLRGNRPLAANRQIDWPFFFAGAPNNESLGNKIDGKVTDAVFELPESAIPDLATTTVNNLTERNLIRSRSIKLTSGERLAKKYGINPVLTPAQIEADANQHKFFDYHGEFATPLWYYILKEAELAGGSHLGPLGSRLVAEVIAGGIYYNRNVGQEAFVFDPSWKAVVKNKTTNVVKFEDLFTFVAGQTA